MDVNFQNTSPKQSGK